VAGHDVTTIFPSDYGVGGYEGLVLAGKRTIKEHPDVVRRFVQASQKGWRYAVEHPDEAAQILLKWAPDPGLEFQQQAVAAVGPLVDAPPAPIGWIEIGRWQRLMGDAYDPAHPGYTMTFSADR
jgi:ABC-type nitrate/sulfonate/bicarbonate transport system substrate-binding protein